MTFFSSGYISQAIGGQNAQFAQNNYLAQQMAVPHGGQQMGPPPPPMMMPPPPSLAQSAMNMGGYGAGMAGERMAGGAANFAANIAAPLAVGGVSMFGALGEMGMLGRGGLGMLGRGVGMLDPMNMAFRGGAAAFGAAGGGMGGLAAGIGAAALPLGAAYGGAKLAQAYGGAFTGGIQDQMALNQTLRQNVNFVGGTGQGGMGFNQQQMGAIGGVMQQELNSNVHTSAQELNQLIAGGTQAGMFTGVRDVGAFTTKFKQMIDTLKTVQKELGGSLTEALNFVNESRQAGIYQQMDRAQFATQIRQTTQITGMSQADALQLASQGAQIARQAGGYGAQGAFGAVKMAQTMGTALTTGSITEQGLSEATGGQTGQAAIQAFTQRMMQHTGRFMSRGGMGRFSLYALAGENGGIDPEMMARFQAGDISVGDVSRRAHQNVGRMGRAQAINRAGELRGAVMEQGGLSGQIGMMRLMLGDRVMNQGDDMAQLVMQRRFGMSRQESEVVQGLIRNQGRIAMQETSDRSASARGARREHLVSTERSLDAVMRNVGHGIQEGLGINEVRTMGRRFMTRISSGIERTMNEFLGIMQDEMGNNTRQAAQRAGMGVATQSDMARLKELDRIAATGSQGSFDPFRQGIAQRLGPGQSLGGRLESMGFDISGFGTGAAGRMNREVIGGISGRMRRTGTEMQASTRDAVSRIQMARAGIVEQGLQGQLGSMLQDSQGTTQQILEARLQARGRRGGQASDMFSLLKEQGMAPEAAMAFMSRQGMAQVGGSVGMEQIVGESDAIGGIGRDIGRAATMGLGALGGAAEEFFGLERGDVFGFLSKPMETFAEGSREQALGFLTRGGHVGRRARSRLEEARGLSLDTRTRHASRIRQEEDTLRAVTGGAEGLNSETMAAIFDSQDMQTATFMMRNPGKAREGLNRLQELAARERDPAKQAHYDALLKNAREAVEKDGVVGSEFVTAALSSDARQQAMAAVRERENIGMSISHVGRGIAARLGGEGSALSRRMMEVGAGFQSSYEEGQAAAHMLTQDFLASTQEEQNQFMGMLAKEAAEGATPEDRAQASAQLAGLSEGRRVREGLMGVGRGGRRGGRRLAVETASQQFGGIGTGRGFQLEIGGRQVGGRRAQHTLMNVLRGRGTQEVQASVREALTGQMERAGLDEGIRGELIKRMEAVANAGTEAEREEAAKGVTSFRAEYAEDFNKLDQQQAKEADRVMRSRDPMGTERNQLLTQIRDGIKNVGNDTGVGKGEGGGVPGVNMSGGG